MAFLSSLNRHTQNGGAYLRIDSIKKIYNNLGIEVVPFYLDDAQEDTTLKDYLSIIRYGKKPLILFKKKKIDLRGYKLIHLDNIRHFNWNILRDPDSKIIYNAHNIETENFYQRENSYFSNNFFNFELSCINTADHTLVCSQREKDIICKNNKSLEKKVSVLPNLIEKENYHHSSIKKNILFLGTLDYYPNTVAVEYLATTFSNNIRKLAPQLLDEYEFIIAGKNPLEEHETLIENSIFFLKKNLSYEEVAGLLSCSYITLVPLTHGSGTRLKILEAIMSHSIVLSTHLGCEGISDKNIHCSTIDNFTESFIDIIKNNIEFDPNQLPHFHKRFDLSTWFNENSKSLSTRINDLCK